MWNYHESNFKTILDYVTANPFQPYIVELTNKKEILNLHICLEDVFLTYPYQFSITIYDASHNKQARCNFFIYSNFCEIIKNDSDMEGLESIMFHIIENMIKEVEIKQHIDIKRIVSTLSYIHHKDQETWRQSIPFYCMKAHEYDYKISFRFHSENYIFETNRISHDDLYLKALNFAHKAVNKNNSGSFIIDRNQET